MNNLTSENLEYLSENIKELVESSSLSSNQEKIIRLRYGLDNGIPASVKEMTKVLKLPLKELKKEINSADRKVFNILKSKL